MALDHALARCVREGGGVLRLYAWAGPTVSFGRNEPARGRYSTSAALDRGIEYVRRPTGGRAVLHASEVTYAVVAPTGTLGGSRAAYARINGALAAAMRALGAAVSVASRGAALAPDAGPCFLSPAEGEVVAGGRKLVGSAQARLDGALLQHGSIMLSGDQTVLSDLSGDAAVAPATLTGLLGGTAVRELSNAVATALCAAFEAEFGGDWRAGGYTTEELEEADRLEGERYAREAWTWRR
jgi:lipoate-protein ligase A